MKKELKHRYVPGAGHGGRVGKRGTKKKNGGVWTLFKVNDSESGWASKPPPIPLVWNQRSQGSAWHRTSIMAARTRDCSPPFF